MGQYYEINEMKKDAGEINTQNNELKKIIADMESIITEMSSVWKDPAQQQFSKQFGEIKPELDKFCAEIGSFAQDVLDHARKIEEESAVY